MKKQNYVQYLLVALSVIIYGAIASKVWIFLNPPDEFVTVNKPLLFVSNNKIEAKDTFSISLDYLDPFTGAGSSRKKKKKINKLSSSNKKKKEKQLVIEDTKIVPPKVIYQGYSINNNNVNRVRLQLDEIHTTFQLNEEKLGIVLLSMSKDSIIISHMGQLFTIFRN